MIIVCDVGLGWTRQPSRRARQPAASKPFDPRKTVKPTSRGKYGLAPRRQKLEQVGEEEELGNTASVDSSRRAATPRHTQLYQQIVEGAWPGLAPQQQRQQLFSRPGYKTQRTVSPELLRKVIPAINHTNYWPRLQRKILPKYLFVLNDVAAVALLRTLVRLQPPLVASVPAETAVALPGGHDSAATSAASVAAQPRQQQEPLRQSAYAASSSITGAFHRRHSLLANSAAASSAAEPAAALAALDAAAVARGFDSATDERSQFDLMLTAVYTVFQHKLTHWSGKNLVKAIGYVARLGVLYEGFLQSWFHTTTSQLPQLDATRLMVCIEALGALNIQPPQLWRDSWTAASQASMQQLSLQQLAMLLMHIAELQLQLPQSWWEEYSRCVSVQARLKQQCIAMGNQQQAIQQQQLGRPQPGQTPAAQQHQQLTRPAADALCSILVSLSFLPGMPADVGWLQACLALLVPAVTQRRCSAGAAVQLLHACTLGVCRQLPAAPEVRQLCLQIVQQRASKVCASSGTLQLLLECLSALGTEASQADSAGDANVLQPQEEQQWQQQQQLLWDGFCEDLEEALAPVLPHMPFHVLLKVASVLACLKHQPGVQLLSTFVLATCRVMPQLGSGQVAELAAVCEEWGVVMPNVWVASVIQHLGQQVQQQPSSQIGEQSQVQQPQQQQQGPGRNELGVEPSDVAQLLNALPRLGINWPAVQATHKHAGDLSPG